MPDMLSMTTLKVCNPVPLLVLVKAEDDLLQPALLSLRWGSRIMSRSCSPIRA